MSDTCTAHNDPRCECDKCTRLRNLLEPPKCEYCGATRKECSGCGAEVGHTVVFGTQDDRWEKLKLWLSTNSNGDPATLHRVFQKVLELEATT